MSVEEIAFQLAVWGWCVTGADGMDPRQGLRDCHVASLVENTYYLDGWWDRDIAQLWTVEVDRGMGTTRPPFWYALAGLSWSTHSWWLDDRERA